MKKGESYRSLTPASRRRWSRRLWDSVPRRSIDAADDREVVRGDAKKMVAAEINKALIRKIKNQ